MAWNKNIIFLGLSVFMFVNCKNAAGSEGFSKERLADLICQCAAPIVSYNQDIKKLAAVDNIGALSKKMAEGDQIMKDAHNCIIGQLGQNTIPIIDDEFYQNVEISCQLEVRMIDDLLSKISRD